MKTALKFIILLFVFIISFSAVYIGLGLIFKIKQEPKPIFLKVVGFWDPRVFNTLKKQFQDKNPQITIEYEQKDPTRYSPNLKADLATNKTPDVFWWHSGWGPELKQYLASLPSSVLSGSDYEKTYYPVTKTDMKIDNTYRGIPLEIDGLALLYNKDLLASSNFSEPPKTWLTLRENYVPALTLRNDKQIFSSAIALGSVVNVENFPEIVGLFLLQNGVSISNNRVLNLYKDKDTDTNKLAIDAVNFFYLFTKKDRTWDNTLPNSIEAFAKGKTAMILLPAYKIPKLKTMVAENNLKLNFGVEPVPQLPETQPVSWASYWALGVSSNSQEKEASWKLVDFLSQKDSLRTIYQMETSLTGFGRAYPRVDMAKEQTTNPYLAAYLTQAPYAKSWFLNSDTFDKGLDDSVVEAFKTALNKIEKGSSTGDTLKKLNSDLNPILKKYGVTN